MRFAVRHFVFSPQSRSFGDSMSPYPLAWILCLHKNRTIEDTVVPLQFPICDARTGKTTRDLLVTKGTPVYLGLSAANRSTSIWGPDAAQFKPERWINKLGQESTFENTRLPGIYSNM